jgi:hypothetical protein
MSEPVKTEEAVPLEVEEIDAPRKPVEAWQAEHQVPAWKHAGACYRAAWAKGREVTEAEYLEAVNAFASHPIGRE